MLTIFDLESEIDVESNHDHLIFTQPNKVYINSDYDKETIEPEI